MFSLFDCYCFDIDGKIFGFWWIFVFYYSTDSNKLTKTLLLISSYLNVLFNFILFSMLVQSKYCFLFFNHNKKKKIFDNMKSRTCENGILNFRTFDLGVSVYGSWLYFSCCDHLMQTFIIPFKDRHNFSIRQNL